MEVPFAPRRVLSRGARAAALAGLALGAMQAQAAESFRLRHSPLGTLGGEMAAPGDSPGFFGTATLTHAVAGKVTDGGGNGLTTPSRTTLSAPPLAGYTLSGPANAIDFHQTQTTLNLMGGHRSERTYAGGRIALAVNIPLVQVTRSFSGPLGAGTLTTPTGLAVPPGSPLTAAANTAAAAQWNALVAAQNDSVTGFGDAELSAAWIRHDDRMKLRAAASLFVPTGSYDRNRGPNPGFGNFYTLRLGGAVSYALDPQPAGGGFASGVTVSGRFGFGINTRNKDTQYRSGSFVFAEAGAVKVAGDWGFGANLHRTQQVTDDDGPVRSASCLGGVAPDGCRLRAWAFSPFIAYRLPGQDAGLNLQYSQTFGERNALEVRALQLRFIKGW